MKFKLLIASLLGIFALSSCSSTGGDGGGAGVEVPKINPKYTIYLKGTPEWRDVGDIRSDLGPKVKITNSGVVDLMGGEVSGKNLKHPSNSQSESSVGIKTRISNLTLRNGYVTDIPGGIVTFAPNTKFERLVFTKIGEDAVSNQKDVAPGTQIINCDFYNTSKGDKSIQLNDGREVLVSGTEVYGGITGMRLQESSGKKQNGVARIENSLFKNLKTGINAAGKTTVYLKNVKFEGVGEPTHTSYDTVKFIKE